MPALFLHTPVTQTPLSVTLHAWFLIHAVVHVSNTELEVVPDELDARVSLEDDRVVGLLDESISLAEGGTVEELVESVEPEVLWELDERVVLEDDV